MLNTIVNRLLAHRLTKHLIVASGSTVNTGFTFHPYGFVYALLNNQLVRGQSRNTENSYIKMSFELNWATLIVGLGIFLLAVFVKPLVMVLRDKVVWKYIEKYVVNDDMTETARAYVRETRRFEIRTSFVQHIMDNDDGDGRDDSYLEIEITVEKLTYDWESFDFKGKHLKLVGKQIEEIDRLIGQLESKLRKRKSTYELLVKHNSLEGLGNPIEEAISRQFEIFEKIEPNTEAYVFAIEKLISEVIENGQEWLESRKKTRRQRREMK